MNMSLAMAAGGIVACGTLLNSLALPITARVDMDSMSDKAMPLYLPTHPDKAVSLLTRLTTGPGHRRKQADHEITPSSS